MELINELITPFNENKEIDVLKLYKEYENTIIEGLKNK